MTPELQGAMQETLERNEQTLLFLNRRGFAGFPVCMDCGESLKCKNCEITLTFHHEVNAYKCHYCGFTRASKSKCKTCGSDKVKLLGLGTEKVESAVKALFPQARVTRMDRDTTRKKGALLRILKAIRNHDVDIIVGTQMVAKGHDFPNITLVGVICADLSMSFPDFRAGERTFQLLTQVAGRAGRGTVPGRVVLQTYNPEHFSIQAAKEQDFKAFYDQEIVFRKNLNYPPFSRMIQLQISGIDPEKTRNLALILGDACQGLRKSGRVYVQSIDVLGPIAAPLAKIAGHYRWQILLKGLRVKLLHQYVHRLMSENGPLFNNRSVNVTVDVDPVFMM
jgi:primosomal protein N' (replication factor Y)